MGTYTLGGKTVRFNSLIELSAARGEVELTYHDRQTPGGFDYTLTVEESLGRGRDERVTIWLTRDEVAKLALAFERVRL